MMLSTEQKEQLINELLFAASRSSGPGGQNVNKVNTKVELRFILAQSKVLSDEQIQLLTSKLETQLTAEGEILIVSQATRSQLKNKEDAIEKLILLLEKNLKIQRKRKATRPTGASVIKRLETKKQLSQKKNLRKKLD
jgi:ribosome-associated protein